MSPITNTLDLIGRLLSYPEPGTVQLAERLCTALRTDVSEAPTSAIEFLAFLQQADDREIEEVFTHTFDISPACALEVGWHLFGEEYIRGLFLVRMREELRKYGLPETVELPDHIAHVLGVAAAMPAEEATRFVCACVLPAVKKMNRALSDKETPYRHILSCLELVLTTQWGDACDTANEESQAASESQTDDPLRAYPVRDITSDCEACGRAPSDAVPQNLIPRETEFPDIGDWDEGHETDRVEIEVAGPGKTISKPLRATDREESPTPTPARKR